ncbi:polar amino acid transport system substrate-binding protein [Pseudomonas duriflava]|uniref:Polar amino acid transport system substrate-binding protein n=1 Tax=Pseudomonas duriflava TaxID=459528 RepID=A0A562QDN1_9PSED|nr:polar amino acid transport system substrate-binding protein [Pseudomonas duriflava]
MSTIKRLKILLGALILSAGPSLMADEGPLRIVTEELPPYNMTRQGQITGFSTEVIQAVLSRIGMQGHFQSMPWARAYDIALSNENVLIYSIARIPEREQRFKWVGVIAPSRWGLFSLKSRNLSFTQLNDAQRYQIATVNGDVGQQYLQSKGFEMGRNLQSSNTHEQNYLKLRSGRVDLWIANEVMARYLVRQGGEDPAKVIESVYPVKELDLGEGLYMAFGVKTADVLVKRFQDGLAAIHADGTYAALVKKWLQ